MFRDLTFTATAKLRNKFTSKPRNSGSTVCGDVANFAAVNVSSRQKYGCVLTDAATEK
jgi:hypothetical protein